VVTEARLERVASGLAPVTPGWFIVNTADAAWVNNKWSGGVCIFESDDFVLRGRPDLTEYVKPNAGFTIRVVPPGQPAGLYHAESVQEDFLILMGECVLIIEDQERHLRAWIHNPFNWMCDCDPTCWCVRSRLGRAVMWYVPSRFHRRPPKMG
jgi:hypothetical protein